MGFRDWLSSWANGTPTKAPKGPSALPKKEPDLLHPQPTDLPVGQVSIDTTVTFNDLFNSLLSDYNTVNAKFPFEYLELINTLSIINPNISQAVSNIVLLGNTGHILKLDGPDSERAANRLADMSKIVYYRAAGIDGLINALLSQVARGGAVSVEWVIGGKLKDGISRAHVVPTSSIRWVYNPNIRDFYPVQIIKNGTWVDYAVASNPGGAIRLNQYTYNYFALDTLDDSPYAIPPILAALESVYIQRDMITNLKFISKKLGLLGFLNLMITAPNQMPGESEEKFRARCDQYLQETANRVQKDFKDGIAIGFKDMHQFNHTSVSGDARGAAEIFKMNEELMFSGLKTDPSMQGRNYSSTETYAGIVYEKMLSQNTNYQRLVKRSVEWGYRLDLMLLGVDSTAEVLFNENKSVNAVLDAAADIKKIQAARMLYEDGVISQDERARRLGYDTPDQEEPRYNILDPGESVAQGGPTGSATPPKKPAASPAPKNPKQKQQHSPQIILQYDRGSQSYRAIRDTIWVPNSRGFNERITTDDPAGDWLPGSSRQN